jgi:hypothetical protein
VRERKGYVPFDRKRGDWIARTSVTDDNGKRRFVKRRAKSKTEAEAKLKSLLRQIDDEGSKVVDFNLLTFNYLADHYEKRYLHEAIYVDGQKVSGLRDVARPKQLLKHFCVFFGKKKLREISYGDLLTYRDKRFKVHTQYKRQGTLASWNREAAVLRRIFNIACQQGWMLKNPFHSGDSLIIVSAERRREKILNPRRRNQAVGCLRLSPVQETFKASLDFPLRYGLPQIRSSQTLLAVSLLRHADYYHRGHDHEDTEDPTGDDY